MKGAVFQRGPTWYYKFRAPDPDMATGRYPWITKGGFRTEKEAWKSCRDAMRKADDGRVVQPTARSVAQFFEEWFAGVEPTLDATTWQNWKDYARLYVVPRIGGERLQHLDEPQLLKLYGSLLSEGRIKPDRDIVMYTYWVKGTANGESPAPREVSESCGTTIYAARAAVRRYKSGIVPKRQSPGLAPKTVRNIHTMIHRALADAVAWKYIGDNPASNVKPPKKSRSRRPVWNSQQIQAFLKSIQGDRFATLFLLELTTGVRRGQICGLKWSDVDLNAALITVHDNRVVVAGHAVDKAGGKTVNADQTIAIDRATVAALRQWQAQQATERTFFGRDYESGDYVFTFEDGRPPHPDSIRQRFDRLAVAAGLARITFHDLRHSYATGALRAGINPKVVSERIGHADVGYFLQTYAHVSLDDDREAAEKAAGFVIGDAWDGNGNGEMPGR
ncbi:MULTISPECIES: tyrosine-type recombinase/integrase [unclassified Mycobacterium]|uniref:tyrosine-type recombinase/integrase n=1 Tax=unclassified Mycobacterium TaxID=2642494 RepID=UPI0029C76092|nr:MULTISPECIES: tyrosine-type recombinase/integrase [unclassified Mycobacterium]